MLKKQGKADVAPCQSTTCDALYALQQFNGTFTLTSSYVYKTRLWLVSKHSKNMEKLLENRPIQSSIWSETFMLNTT